MGWDRNNLAPHALPSVMSWGRNNLAPHALLSILCDPLSPFSAGLNLVVILVCSGCSPLVAGNRPNISLYSLVPASLVGIAWNLSRLLFCFEDTVSWLLTVLDTQNYR